MRKLFSLIAAVLFAGSMMADSFTITFKEGTGTTSDGSAKQTTIAGIISDGADYVSAVEATEVYNGRVGRGIKMGTGSKAGSLTLTLAESVNATSIVVTARKYNDTEKAFAIQGTDFTAGDGGDFAEYTYTYDAATEISSIALTSPKRIYFTSLTVNYEAGEVPPTPAGCDWDNIAYAGNGSGNADYTDRFKVCLGDPAPNFVNLQAPDWATEAGFYFEFPSAAWGTISLEEGEYQIQGAGILLFASAFLYDAEKEVTIVCQDVTYTLTVKNANPEVAPVVLPTYTCAQVQANAATEEGVLNEVQVLFVNGGQFYVRDASGMTLVYKSNNGLAIGNIVSGIHGVSALHNNAPQFQPSNEVADWTVTEGDAPVYDKKSVVPTTDEVNGVYIFENVIFAEAPAYSTSSAVNATATIGEQTVTIRDNYKKGATLEANKAYDILGVVSVYNNAAQIYFISATEHTTTAIDNTVVSEKAIKMFENGQLIIIKNGVKYNAQGAVVR